MLPIPSQNAVIREGHDPFYLGHEVVCYMIPSLARQAFLLLSYRFQSAKTFLPLRHEARRASSETRMRSQILLWIFHVLLSDLSNKKCLTEIHLLNYPPR